MRKYQSKLNAFVEDRLILMMNYVFKSAQFIMKIGDNASRKYFPLTPQYFLSEFERGDSWMKVSGNCFYSLPDNKILALFKLKAIADDYFIVALDRVEEMLVSHHGTKGCFLGGASKVR